MSTIGDIVFMDGSVYTRQNNSGEHPWPTLDGICLFKNKLVRVVTVASEIHITQLGRAGYSKQVYNNNAQGVEECQNIAFGQWSRASGRRRLHSRWVIEINGGGYGMTSWFPQIKAHGDVEMSLQRGEMEVWLNASATRCLAVKCRDEPVIIFQGTLQDSDAIAKHCTERFGTEKMKDLMMDVSPCESFETYGTNRQGRCDILASGRRSADAWPTIGDVYFFEREFKHVVTIAGKLMIKALWNIDELSGFEGKGASEHISLGDYEVFGAWITYHSTAKVDFRTVEPYYGTHSWKPHVLANHEILWRSSRGSFWFWLRASVKRCLAVTCNDDNYILFH